jgi:hypothetical protein
MDGNDTGDNLSQALEYRNSLRHELVFDSTWDQELEGEATGLSGGSLAGGRNSLSARRGAVLGGVGDLGAQGCSSLDA